jgi:hypothetical protein
MTADDVSDDPEHERQQEAREASCGGRHTE